jgi:DNA ligase-1
MTLLNKLYSRTSIGQVAEWQIEVNGDSYRTHEGIVGGKITTSNYTKCEPKNIGKKNETSAEEQALKEAQAKHKKKIESGYFENINEIDNQIYFEPMLAHKWSDLKDSFSFPVYTQPKLDGMRCVISKNGMFSRNGKPIISAPHIFESVKKLFEEEPNLVLDGELYNHQLKHNFNKIISLAKKSKPKPEDLSESKNLIQYFIYDCFLNEKFEKRFKKISEISNTYSDFVKLTETHLVNSNSELDMLYERWMEEGYEGQMIRINSKYENKRSKFLIKRKEFIDEEFEIIDILDGKGNREGLATKVIFKNKDGSTFDTGVIGNDEYTSSLLSNKLKYIGKKATVVYQNLTPDGAPRFGKMKIIRDYE